MLHAFLTLAAEESETSKTAFYIAGGVLAVWAVVLAAIGMRQPDFPTSSGAARGVMGLSALLTLAAMVAIVVTA